MAKIILCIGSNNHAAEHMAKARLLLSAAFEGIAFTNNVQTEPIGVNTPIYTNCMAQATSTLNYDEIRRVLKSIEAQCGDAPDLRQKCVVNMDIDLLQLGRKRYKAEDWKRYYVKELKKELDQLTAKQP